MSFFLSPTNPFSLSTTALQPLLHRTTEACARIKVAKFHDIATAGQLAVSLDILGTACPLVLSRALMCSNRPANA